MRSLGIPREEDLRPGTIIGEYRVEGKLGEGGMASVFSALHPLIGKKVAIKVISRRLCADVHAVDRFIGEARTVNQIGHPNLVDIFAFGVLPDGRAYLVMEWLQGETLADRLHRERLPSPVALELLLQIVDALEAAHEKGVIHRDLKPQNIFLVERKESIQVKLLDFGIAKLADSDASVPKTRSGVAMGTAGYMSPEQARGKNVDHRTDIYALGCVAYEVLLGRIPFVADTAIDILAMHLASAVPSPRTLWPDIPAGLERVLTQMLSKEPDGRPSLQQVRAVFDSSHRSITPPAGVPAVKARPAGRVAAWIAAGATAVLAGVGAAGWMLSRRSPERPQPPKSAPTPVPPTNSAARASTPMSPRAPAPLPVPPPSLVPPPANAANLPATLIVHVPPGAHIRINGHSYAAHGPMLKVDLPGGEHKVVVTAAGHARFEQRVRVAPGATAEVVATPAARAATSPPSAASEGPDARPGATSHPAPPTSAPTATATAGSTPTSTPASTVQNKPAAPAKPETPQPSPHGDYTLDPFK